MNHHNIILSLRDVSVAYDGYAALEGVDLDIYDRRRKLMVNSFNAMGMTCFEPEGAFYIYPNIGKFGLTSEAFCEKLLYEHKCAIVPGIAFGAAGEGFARISYAYSVKHINQALERMEAFIKPLK